MKPATHIQKNVVTEEVETKKSFSEFLSNFTTIRKADKGFFFWDDRRVDHVVIKSAAQTKGIKDIPSEQELVDLL